MLAGVLGSALLLALYARGGAAWPLGFVALVPWLLALDAARSPRAALGVAWLMSVAFAGAVFAWFGFAVSAFTGLPPWATLAALLLAAPLLQAQLLAFALVRSVVGRRHGTASGGAAAICAWVATERWWPKLLGDTLGHGLHPAEALRQCADLGGAAGLTVLLLAVNVAIAAALAQRGRSRLRPLAFALAAVVLAWGYGAYRLHALEDDARARTPLRVAMVQSNIVDYERLRREAGAYAVVRRVLDTHFAMSQLAVDNARADALLWSETVYPTTFGVPKSADGAALDGEILAFVARAGVPLVFGSYDADAQAEYNAAMVVDPAAGLVGGYRKTRPFPLTEHVPRWLDGPALRRLLPWAGTWQRGDGPRVYPLRLRDGREVPVSPLICLDAVDPDLAIGSARLGAQALFVLSNDAWFTAHPAGARLHLAVSAFRSVETRLPQLRATTNGISAVIDRSGAVVERTAMGERALLVGDVAVGAPPATLMVRWGDWVGHAAGAALLLLAAWSAAGAWRARRGGAQAACRAHPATATLLTPPQRWLIAALRVASVAALAWLGVSMLLEDGLRIASLSRIWAFAAWVAAPAVAAWLLLRMASARLRVESGALRLDQGARTIEVPLASIAAVEPWRVPLPTAGARLRLGSGRRLPHDIALPDPSALARVLAESGAALPAPRGAAAFADRLARVRAAAPRWRVDAPWFKFALFPLLPALVAFRLHQHIAFGGTFGEWLTFGPQAWITALLIWWASWSIGLVLLAALLRALVGAATLPALALREPGAAAARRWLESSARALYFLGVPAWLALRLLSG